MQKSMVYLPLVNQLMNWKAAFLICWSLLAGMMKVPPATSWLFLPVFMAGGTAMATVNSDLDCRLS